MGKKSTLKKIRRMAGDLPVMLEKTIEKHEVKGSELIDQGDTERDGKPIEADTTYIQDMPVVMSVNHKRRMLKELRRGGIDAVIDYKRKIVDQYNKSRKSV